MPALLLFWFAFAVKPDRDLAAQFETIAKSIKGRVLILHGMEDPVAPLEEVNALISQLRGAKVNFEVDLYSGAAHAFTKPQNPSEVRADEEYKVAMARFLKDVLVR